MKPYIVQFSQLGMTDVESVGGKNASLGEMIRQLTDLGVTVPGGFATTATAYRDFLAQGGLDKKIHKVLAELDVDDVVKLARTGAEIRGWIMDTPLQPRLHEELSAAWKAMTGSKDIAVAVRSSATAEDLPEASFAGQQETFLNVRGLDAVLKAVHEVFASLFNDRAIAYRVHQDFDHSLRSPCQPACSTWCAAISAPAASCSRWIPSRVSATSSLSPPPRVSARRWCRARSTRTSSTCYKPSLRAGKTAIVRRNLGGKAIKMVYGDDGDATQDQSTWQRRTGTASASTTPTWRNWRARR